jgi:hypothetical protein
MQGVKHMRLIIISFFAFVGACAPIAGKQAETPSAPDRAAILQTVDAFFLALGAADAEAMEMLHSSVALNVRNAPDDETKIRYHSLQELTDQMRNDDFPVVRERYWNPTVLQRAGLAVVWAPYSIDVSDARLHCGVDVFNLSKHDDGWKIDALSFTIEPSACDELESKMTTQTNPDYSALDAKEE